VWTSSTRWLQVLWHDSDVVVGADIIVNAVVGCHGVFARWQGLVVGVDVVNMAVAGVVA